MAIPKHFFINVALMPRYVHFITGLKPQVLVRSMLRNGNILAKLQPESLAVL